MNKKVKKTIKIIAPVVCVFCGKDIKSIHGEDYSMVDDGIVSHLYAPYGSCHDGDIFQIAICDKCVEEKEKEDKIVLIGSYIFGEVVNHRGEIVKVEYD